MEDTNSDDGPPQEILEEMVDFIDDSIVPEVVLEIYAGVHDLEHLLSEFEFTTEELVFLESRILRTSGLMGFDLPSGYKYIPISRLYTSILEDEQEISSEIQKGIEEVKDEEDYEEASPERKETIGKVISETKHLMRRRFVTEKSADNLLLLLSLVSEMLSNECEVLFESSLVHPEYQLPNEKTADLIENLSQDQIEALLLRVGPLSSDLRSELYHVRDTRNKMVHNIQERLLLSNAAEAASEAERAVKALNEIVEINEGVRPIYIR